MRIKSRAKSAKHAKKMERLSLSHGEHRGKNSGILFSVPLCFRERYSSDRESPSHKHVGQWRGLPAIVSTHAMHAAASIAFLAMSLPFIAHADPPLLVTVPTPLKIVVNESGGLDIQSETGKALGACRPYLASRPVGDRAWQEETSTYKVISQDAGKLELEAQFAKFTCTVTLRRDASGRWEFSGRLDSTTRQPMELARFHYLDGLVTDRAMNLLSMRRFELRGGIIKPSDKLLSPKAVCEAGWGKSVYWPRLADPIHSQTDIGISGDTGMLASDWNSPGFFFGFAGPGSAFGELGIRTEREKTSFFAAVLLDAVRIEPKGARLLESAILSYGDPQDELRHWAVVCRDVLGPPRVRPPLVGYCSWYQKYQSVEPVDIRRAIDTFASYEAPAGGRTIQIDDGFQVCPGDWSGRGEWKTELKKLPGEIAGKGFIPGIWIAPTAIHSGHPIVKEHPDWLQRDAKGGFCIRFHNWGETYFLEPDHPGARKFIVDTLRQLRADGWRYFKIDFAYTVSSDRVKWEPHKTTYETLRDQWRLFREALGEDALINSCVGGIWRYSLGSVDVSRIGGDIGGNMGVLQQNLSEMMWRSHVNGLWFQADPDAFYMRNQHSKLNFEQSHLLTSTQGILGTAFLTSDFGDQWSPAAAGVVRSYWNKTGPRVPLAQHLILRADGLPSAISVAYGKGEYAVGIYNWSRNGGDVSVSLKDLRLPVGGDYSAALSSIGNETVALTSGILTVFKQPGESLRIIGLRSKTTHL